MMRSSCALLTSWARLSHRRWLEAEPKHVKTFPTTLWALLELTNAATDSSSARSESWKLVMAAVEAVGSESFWIVPRGASRSSEPPWTPHSTD
jgi:hypothetical protein